MPKVFLHINVSLDGFIEDAHGAIDWHFVDDEFEEYINHLLRSVDGMIFGRVAHQLLAGYWPTAGSNPDASERHRESAELMNRLPKYVVTRGPYETTWENSHVLSGDIAARIAELRERPGKDLALFAGAGVTQSFTELGLIDEYRLVVNPVLLGSGKPLFAPGHHRSDLRLVDVRTFRSGAIVLVYRPDRAGAQTGASGRVAHPAENPFAAEQNA